MTTNTIDIERKRGDTRRIIFRITARTAGVRSAVDITNWTAFKLTIDPEQAPETADNNLISLVGFIINGAEGRVGFTPSGNLSPGKFFYDAEGVDDNVEKTTFAEGSYTITQDITK